jgi:hypothetical protein
MLAISIISGIGVLLGIIHKLVVDVEFDLPTSLTAIFIISVWNLCFPLAIITICLAFIAIIVGVSR